LPEVVGSPGDGAMTVPPGDPGALAQMLIDVLADDELRARLGRNARALAEQEWDSRVEAERFAALYEELVA
jgi:glycosyltransferase involved in cell wall biosynthesis